MSSKRFVFSVLALGLVLVSERAVRADDYSADAASTVLFKEAKALAAKGDFEHACPKFQESQRLRPGVGTLLNIGDCLEKLGRLASAWGAFNDAEMLARTKGDTDRQGEATRRAQLLAPNLAKLAIVVPPAVRVPGIEVLRDGLRLGEAQWGSAIPVDTGQHTIEAKAPGRKSFSSVLRVDSDGSSTSFEIPTLEIADTTPTPTPAPLPFWTSRRVAGVVVGSVGIASAITGAVFGGLALAKASSSKAHCQDTGDTLICDQAGLDLRSTGRTFAKTSDVTLILGCIATAAGIGLVAAPSSSSSSSPAALRLHANPTFAGLSVEGTW
jgi:hypothetical protein